jgi:uncharacterized protein YndB with AHSA1/START domain
VTELRLSRRFDAPPERVFEAWTDPAVLRRWWAAHPDWDSPAAETDQRTGGRYRLSMTDTSSCETRTVAGEYAQTGFPDEHDRDMHADGWCGCLDNLARRLFADG